MKQLEKILDKVKEIKNMQKNSYSDKYILDATIELEKLVQEEYFKVYAKETKTSKQYASATRLLKRSKNRPILQHVHIDENGHQVFTDGYRLYKMKRHIPNLPLLKDNESLKGETYPRTDRIIPINLQYNMTFKVKDFKALMVETKQGTGIDATFTIKLDNIDLTGFTFNSFTELFDILDFKNNDTFTLQYNANVKPFLVYNEHGDLGLILPVRIS